MLKRVCVLKRGSCRMYVREGVCVEKGACVEERELQDVCQRGCVC